MMEKLRLPFPMLSDEDRTAVIEPWGLANPDDPRNLAHPAIVVVDEGRRERFRWESHEYAFRLPEDRVLSALTDMGFAPTTQAAPRLGRAATGPRAVPLRALAPYLRGARFAAVAFGKRYPEIEPDVEFFVEQMDRYSSAVRNLKARLREEERGSR